MTNFAPMEPIGIFQDANGPIEVKVECNYCNALMTYRRTLKTLSTLEECLKCGSSIQLPFLRVEPSYPDLNDPQPTVEQAASPIQTSGTGTEEF